MEPEIDTADECTCEPFVIVRYRDARQEPSIVFDVDQINYWTNDDWLVLARDEAGETTEVFAARSSEVLSVERVE